MQAANPRLLILLNGMQLMGKAEGDKVSANNKQLAMAPPDKLVHFIKMVTGNVSRSAIWQCPCYWLQRLCSRFTAVLECSNSGRSCACR